jgi:hypothetical protein
VRRSNRRSHSRQWSNSCRPSGLRCMSQTRSATNPRKRSWTAQRGLLCGPRTSDLKTSRTGIVNSWRVIDAPIGVSGGSGSQDNVVSLGGQAALNKLNRMRRWSRHAVAALHESAYGPFATFHLCVTTRSLSGVKRTSTRRLSSMTWSKVTRRRPRLRTRHCGVAIFEAPRASRTDDNVYLRSS